MQIRMYIQTIYKKGIMKKMYIVVCTKTSMHKVCTEDLSKMFYFQKKRSPRLPTYQEPTDTEDTPQPQVVSKTMED